MRRAAKVDANHKLIVDGLRARGATVQSLAAVGKGCPDILVGHRGRNLVLEIKDGMKVPSAQQLTDDQLLWHLEWRGQVAIVNSVEQAIAALTTGPRE